MEDAGSSGLSICRLCSKHSSTKTRMKMVCSPGVVGPGVELMPLLICRLWRWHSSYKKNQKEEGPARASPVAAPMPKSDSSERKERMLRSLSIGVPFSAGLAVYL